MITLSNSELNIVIRPDLGGRIDQIYDCKTQRNWLWHPAEYDASQTRSLDVGAAFDPHWTGGWDDIFPNDAAGEFAGHSLVDHGELWSQAWQVIETSPLQVKLRYRCQTVPVAVEKQIRLDADAPKAEITYQLQNQSDQPLPFLFKQHAAIAIATGDEIRLPDCWIEPVDLGFSKLIGKHEKTRFPEALAADGSKINLQKIPDASSRLQEFYYSWSHAVGECGIYNPQTQSTFLLQFESADFPYVWVFQSYGGWQDHYVVVLEPCTTMPYDLEIAARQGTIAQLQAHETQSRKITLTLQR